jgi:UDP-glucose 4-epimerase
VSGPHAVITGGTGFLLGHVAREWLRADPAARATLVSNHPPDAAFKDFIAPVADRVAHVAGDVRRPADWTAGIDPAGVDILVHGAALCPMSEAEERARLARTVDVNVMGTVAALEWARSLPRLRRVIYVSSGVYGYGHVAEPGAPPGRPPEPSPEPPIEETAPLAPEAATYDITKAAGEWLAGRYAALFGLPCLSVRPSAIFGPMDRDSAGRTIHPAPWHMARAARAGRPFRVNHARAGYDWLYAADAGRAIAALMAAKDTAHDVYNVGYGRPATLADLAEGVARVVPGFRLEESATPDFRQPTDRRGGVWRVRSSARLESETGWRPTPLPDAMADYMRWLQAHPGEG